ncbi:26S proteasome non-ATPase regulatory subunit 9 [Nowakowskiella sp. JEL0078]|nr:26S proteasome non-ATPase regulatory subunit 9 [Nowakowskiella sp. JEL0078]
MTIQTSNELATEARKILAEKDEIESKIAELSGILIEQGNVGLNSPLIDSEGFPRADIDVYTVRLARNQIIRLQTDLKEIMKKMEIALYDLHSAKKKENENSSASTTNAVFARVNKVLHDSPASDAGLQSDDLIIRFGDVDMLKCRPGVDPLSEVPSIVLINENVRFVDCDCFILKNYDQKFSYLETLDCCNQKRKRK